jgi:chaperonin cofactor prefoldin
MSSNSSEVEWEDQAKINEFGRINDRVRALNVQIKALKDLHLNLTDAANELLLSDDDYVSVRQRDDQETRCTLMRRHAQMHVGEAFYSMKKDEAEARLETQKTKIEQGWIELTHVPPDKRRSRS